MSYGPCTRCREDEMEWKAGPLRGLCRTCIENDHIGTEATLARVTQERDEARAEAGAATDAWEQENAERTELQAEVERLKAERDDAFATGYLDEGRNWKRTLDAARAASELNRQEALTAKRRHAEALAESASLRRRWDVLRGRVEEFIERMWRSDFEPVRVWGSDLAAALRDEEGEG